MSADKRVAIMVGGMEMLVDSDVAKMVEIRKRKLRERGIKIARELKEARMLPSFRTNQFSGWVPTTSRKVLAAQSCTASGLQTPMIQEFQQPVAVEDDSWLFRGQSSL